MIHPNGHSDNGNAGVIQEPAGEETLRNATPPDATGSRSNRTAFVILGAGVIVIALLIFVATSMP